MTQFHRVIKNVSERDKKFSLAIRQIDWREKFGLKEKQL